MNNFILFHKGIIPNHLKYCIRQILQTQTNFKVYLLTDQRVIIDGVEVIDINDYNVELDQLSYYKNDRDPLWRTSFERFFYIDKFITKNNLSNVIHFDNDIVIYGDVSEIIDILEREVDEIAITPHKETELVCGFMYIKHSTTLKLLCNYLFELAKVGEAELQRQLNSMPHEMRLLGHIQSITDNYITSLPVTPYGPGNNLFDKFNMVFDPSTYGQYFGNNNTIKPQDTDRLADRFIGTKTIPLFEKVPSLHLPQEDKNIPIFNLHIHNKHLNLFIYND